MYTWNINLRSTQLKQSNDGIIITYTFVILRSLTIGVVKFQKRVYVKIAPFVVFAAAVPQTTRRCMAYVNIDPFVKSRSALSAETLM